MYVKAWSRALVLLLAGCVSVVSWAEGFSGSMRVAPGDQKVLSFPAAVAKVATSDPAVAALTVTGSQELLLTAKEEGSAVLSIWLRGESKPLRSTVVVATTLGSSLPFGTQVQTDIRVLEVSRSELNQMGISYSNVWDGGASGAGIAVPGGGFQTPGVAPVPINSEGFNLFKFGSNSVVAINALEAGGFAYTLAEPSLTSLSGQSASFLSGGEFPVPTRSTTDGVQIEFKEFGIGLSLTPTVIDESQIILKVAPEVSELDFSAGVETGGVAVPGLRVRRAETTVSLAPGETFIISGLVSRNTINNSDRLPGIGNIPLLGAFFRSSRIEKNDKELVMVVTPHLVTPQNSTEPPVTLPGAGYHNSSMGWLDMATESRRGSQPIRHGLSW
ncbi:MAG: pilus assembly protein N-terminal domain-containing protein [Pseudomonadales bacterium]|jgi:pilus assembly protein CpaC|uniref:Secretin n=1 Tax=Alcanivorax profundi TaxID=2338368 RepID=A0A418XZ87_9GAMM|nr:MULTISPECIES: pilus assembly protein N-terminal domain-containing protein [Alcanivorax]ERP89273.1 secretin [Alcanivorax sp. P2S70]MCG8438451.1 pilus assembly protein N-terminal domain-containing protein [Pseudomonadales bacterium]PNE04112.1 type II secretion system protein [Alcanivorax sp. MD8A]RJG18326.1 secretin [Alcanivorax profundi]